MAYLPQQQFIVTTTVNHQPNTSTHKKAKRLNLVITMLISFVSTLTMSWGIALGEVIGFAVGDSSNLRYLGFLVGLGLSIGIAMVISAVIQLSSALLLWLYMRYRNHSRGTYIRPPHCTIKHQISIYDCLNEANFQIWSIIWNTTRGLGLSLVFVLGVLVLSN